MNKVMLRQLYVQDKFNGCCIATTFSAWLVEKGYKESEEVLEGVIDSVMKKGGESKASIARKIFEEERVKGLVRSVVMSRFITEAGLTKHGANTYYGNFREGANLVKKRNNE